MGTFVQGVENCIVLRTDDGKTYEIFGGDPALVAVGSRVVVHGRVRTDMASTCMQGPDRPSDVDAASLIPPRSVKI